jgi:hypothetical protein
LLLGASLILLIPLFFLSRHLLDLWDQYNCSAYVVAFISHGNQVRTPPIPAQPGDKIIIMAKLEQENTDWVAEYLPEYTPFPPSTLTPRLNPAASWQRAIYTVNPSSSSHSPDRNTLTTSLNKGHESMAYLTYIIDHYASLPSTLAFLHSHASGFLCAWHTDTPLHSNIDSMNSLQMPFVQQNGYVNLRCNWNPGCLPAHRYNKHITPEVWHDIFGNASLSQFSHTDEGFVPEQVGTACCAQFAVSRERVLERPRSDYEGFRRWIVETGKSDAQSGRVMEFLWHVIFGMDAV